MQADLINAYKCLMRENKEDGAIFFSVASSERKRGNRHKMKYKKFYLNTFMTWMIKHHRKFPGDFIESSYLKIFKTQFTIS